jgi:hypothetical protein
VTPIGTKYDAPPSLLEQRTSDTYHQRYPWPDDDATRVQLALLKTTTRMADWVVALTFAIATASGLLLVKGCT